MQLSAAELVLLYIIGAGELIGRKAAEYQQRQAAARIAARKTR
jgi:hypothetical protein